MKSLLVLIVTISGLSSALACSDWVKGDGCVYGEMKDGVSWKAQACDPAAICKRVGRNPQARPCEEDYLCLPKNLTPEMIAVRDEPCAPWEKMDKTDASQACGDSRKSLWTREKMCMVIGGTIETQTCSESDPNH